MAAAAAAAMLADVSAAEWEKVRAGRETLYTEDMVPFDNVHTANRLPTLKSVDAASITKWFTTLEELFDSAKRGVYKPPDAASDNMVRQALTAFVPLDQQRIETAKECMSPEVLQRLYEPLPDEDKKRSPAHERQIENDIRGIPAGGGAPVLNAAGDAVVFTRPELAYQAAAPAVGGAGAGPGQAMVGGVALRTYPAPTWAQFKAAVYRLAGVSSDTLKHRLTSLKQKDGEKIGDFAIRINQGLSEYNSAAGVGAAQLDGQMARKQLEDGLLSYLLPVPLSVPLPAGHANHTVATLLPLLMKTETAQVNARDRDMLKGRLTPEMLRSGIYPQLPKPEQHVLDELVTRIHGLPLYHIVTGMEPVPAPARLNAITGYSSMGSYSSPSHFSAPAIPPEVARQMDHMQKIQDETREMLLKLMNTMEKRNNSNRNRNQQHNKSRNNSGNDDTGDRKKRGPYTVTCFKCQKKGHFANRCPNEQAQRQGEREEGSPQRTDSNKPKKAKTGSVSSMSYGSANSISSINQKKGLFDLLVASKVNGIPFNAMLDTGAVVSVISETAYKKLGEIDMPRSPLDKLLQSASGHNVELIGVITVTLGMGKYTFPQAIQFQVCRGMKTDVIIGLDVFRKYGFIIDFGKDSILIPMFNSHIPVIKEVHVPGMNPFSHIDSVKYIDPSTRWNSQNSTGSRSSPVYQVTMRKQQVGIPPARPLRSMESVILEEEPEETEEVGIPTDTNESEEESTEVRLNLNSTQATKPKQIVVKKRDKSRLPSEEIPHSRVTVLSADEDGELSVQMDTEDEAENAINSRRKRPRTDSSSSSSAPLAESEYATEPPAKFKPRRRLPGAGHLSIRSQKRAAEYAARKAAELVSQE